jgi:ATP-binding cassette subfamily F protein 3
VLHIENCSLDSYRGGYSDFERQRAQRVAEQQAQQPKQSRRRAEIEISCAASATRPARRGRRRAASRNWSAWEKRRSPTRTAPSSSASRDPPAAATRCSNCARPTLPTAPRDRCCAAWTSPARRRAHRTAGRNGAGKTTLLRSLCGELPLRRGADLRRRAAGSPTSTSSRSTPWTSTPAPSCTCSASTPEAREQELRDFLGGFDFRGERTEMPLAPFSGGEKARLALALLAWQRPNVLVLDEPTNHLDLEMRRALELALLEFAGATVLVSHDRHLLRSAADRFLHVADGRVEPYDGDLAAYERSICCGDNAGAKVQGRKAAKHGCGPPCPRRSAAQSRAEATPPQGAGSLAWSGPWRRNRLPSPRSRHASRIPRFTTPGDNEELSRLLREQGELRARIDTLEQRWLEEQEALEALSAD